MKKKFDDGGSVRTGGKYTASGDGPLEWQADVPVAAEIGPRVGGPMSGGIGAGLDGIQDAAGRTETLMPFVAGNNEPGRLPIGQIMPPRGRGIGASLAGMGALRAAGMKKGGTVKKMAKGGSTSSASKRADGCAIKGKTKGRFV